MTTFDDRDQGFENKFAHDEEMAFKAIARRNKLLGAWAAGKLGKKGPEAEQYAKDIVLAAIERSGEKGMLEKLTKDFAQAKVAVTVKEIHAEMERLMPLARKQVMGEVSNASACISTLRALHFRRGRSSLLQSLIEVPKKLALAPHQLLASLSYRLHSWIDSPAKPSRKILAGVAKQTTASSACPSPSP